MRQRELHHQSFFAFADAFQAQLDTVREYWLSGVPIGRLPPEIVQTPALQAYWEGMDAGIDYVFRQVLPNQSNIAACVAVHKATRTRAIVGQRTQTSGRGQRQGYRNDDVWRRARLACGAHLSLSENSHRQLAADLLNRGIPRMGRMYQVDGDLIRHAWETVGAKYSRHIVSVNGTQNQIDLCVSICTAMKAEFSILDTVWKRAIQFFGERNINSERVIGLVSSGDLWSWYAEATEETPIELARPADALMLINGSTRSLKDHLRYRQRGEAFATSVRGDTSPMLP